LLNSMRTVKFYTLGCKVNQYDTQLIREGFLARGFKEEEIGPADIYVINTCTVTAAADRKSRYYINYARRQNPYAKIVVTGCYVQLRRDVSEITKIKGIDHIVKNEGKKDIPFLFCRRDKNSLPGITAFKGHTRAFLKIQEGCDNFCSYCKVPLVRGKPKSKPLFMVLKEARGLVKNGFKEIILCGVCLGAYGKDLKQKIGLAKLIKKLEVLSSDGLLRLRLSSIEPQDVTDELVEAIALSKIACRHLHIPLQSGDDKILEKMKRKYSSTDFLNIARKLKKSIPAISITTDVMVGFPGEDEDNFRNTCDLIKRIDPLKVHIFPYSKRAGTGAYMLGNNIPEPVVKKRSEMLSKVCRLCALKAFRNFVNKRMDVLIEARLKEDPRYWYGFTDNYLKIKKKSELCLENKLIRLKVTTSNNAAYFA
ncbi:MAG: tRNA (N(6)-L-threonylcarbamoyladenosine(37)-C(2))-methylthiotransferase MtaB, partial [Candidatus Omnitrophica bacterium]|nr:tRNA (N(6)-L-threonylcarbamoyladenosine(37)-C(2))-methylthiotransferase MtaB [Candidatus Omnitrophota bacterium]